MSGNENVEGEGKNQQQHGADSDTFVAGARIDDAEQIYAERKHCRYSHPAKHWLDYCEVACLALAFFATSAAVYVNYRQAGIASDTESRSLRAYLAVATGTKDGVAFNRLEFDTSGPVPRMIRAWLGITNDGQTPAYDYVNEIGLDVLPRPLTQGYVFPNPRQRHQLPSFGPHSFNAETISANALDADHPLKLIGIDNAIYVYGRISYRDALGDGHWFKYCLFYISAPDPGTYCNQHNESDDSIAAMKASEKTAGDGAHVGHRAQK